MELIKVEDRLHDDTTEPYIYEFEVKMSKKQFKKLSKRFKKHNKQIKKYMKL